MMTAMMTARMIEEWTVINQIAEEFLYEDADEDNTIAIDAALIVGADTHTTTDARRPEDPRGPFGTASARSTSLPKLRRRTAINTPLDAVQWRFLTAASSKTKKQTTTNSDSICRNMNSINTGKRGTVTKTTKKTTTKDRGKRPPIFPTRLYDLLENANAAGYAHVISWYEDGTSFRIHTSCETEIVPILKQRYKSFLRQLQMYGFERQWKGSLKGIYRHPLFVRQQRAVLHNKSVADFQTAARAMLPG